MPNAAHSKQSCEWKAFIATFTFDNQLKWSLLGEGPHGHVALIAARVRVRHLWKIRLLVQFNIILSKQKHVSCVTTPPAFLPRFYLCHVKSLYLCPRDLCRVGGIDVQTEIQSITSIPDDRSRGA